MTHTGYCGSGLPNQGGRNCDEGCM